MKTSTSDKDEERRRCKDCTSLVPVARFELLQDIQSEIRCVTCQRLHEGVIVRTATLVRGSDWVFRSKDLYAPRVLYASSDVVAIRVETKTRYLKPLSISDDKVVVSGHEAIFMENLPMTRPVVHVSECRYYMMIFVVPDDW